MAGLHRVHLVRRVRHAVYGVFFGPSFSARDPLVKAVGTLGFLLILIGTMQWTWGRDAYSITLPTSKWNYQLGGGRG